MNKKLVLLSACLLAGTMAAQKLVKGHVTDSQGMPVAGASIVIPGTSFKTQTDANGNFSLRDVPASAKHVVVSYLGMSTQNVSISDNISVMLQDNNEFDEAIVVAYGTTKKSSFTGSAQNVTSEKLELRPITNVTKGLEGEASGILVSSASGQPGSSPAIRVRGFGSINASSSPLYVVDGIPFDGDLAAINPSDIEQMTILKDASAGALYGARGANGVVMITTKRGKEGKTNVNWRSTVGWSSRATKRYQNVDQKEFVQLTYEALRNGYVYDNGMTWEAAEAAARNALSKELGGELYNPFKNYTWNNIIDPATGQVRADAQSVWNEDWMESVMRNNDLRHEHQLSISGGTEKTKYMFSFGYINEDGTLKTTNFQRYNVRANVESQINDWFKVNGNVSLARTESNFSDYEGASSSNVWYTAQFINPLFPVYLKDAEGKTVISPNGEAQLDWGESKRIGNLNDFSSLGMLLLDKAGTKRDIMGLRTGIVLGGDADRFGFAKGLRLSINLGADVVNSHRFSYKNNKHGNQAKAGGMLEKSNSRTQSYTFNQLVTWDRSFGLHTFGALMGHEWYQYDYSLIQAAKSNLVEGILELRPGTTPVTTDSYSQVYKINSFLSRINYNYNETYYFSASYRRDASSRFHKDHHTGSFWSVGGNWRISNEAFMKPLYWVDNLSFKASYGEQGNDDILDNLGYSIYYLWQSLYNLDWSNGNNIGALISTLENKTLTWEKNGNFNIGLEGVLFNKRIRFSAEYYNKKTSDMLLNYPMALSTGFTGYNANVGSLKNSGFEFELGVTPIRTDDFEWTINWMGATVKNEVTKLTNENKPITSGSRIIRVGAPLNTYYMAKSAGVDPTTGAQLYWAYDKDEKGNITKEYITSDYSKASNSKYELGCRIPDLYGSLATNLSWKGLNLNVLTTYSIGGKVLDGLYQGTMDLMYLSSTWNKHALRRWQKPGDITDVPRIERAGKYTLTDRNLVNASYFAIKNITLSYNLPKLLTQKISVNNVRVFTSLDNLALFTHLDGMDPQYNFSGGTDYNYAPNKTISMGLEVNF